MSKTWAHIALGGFLLHACAGNSPQEYIQRAENLQLRTQRLLNSFSSSDSAQFAGYASLYRAYRDFLIQKGPVTVPGDFAVQLAEFEKAGRNLQAALHNMQVIRTRIAVVQTQQAALRQDISSKTLSSDEANKSLLLEENELVALERVADEQKRRAETAMRKLQETIITVKTLVREHAK